MMSDHSPSMGDEVFMTRKSESGKKKKKKKSIYAKRPKVDLAPFGNKLLLVLQILCFRNSLISGANILHTYTINAVYYSGYGAMYKRQYIPTKH